MNFPLLIAATQPAPGLPLGPALVYLIGVVAVLVFFCVTSYRKSPKDPERERQAEIERRKDQAFTRALIRSAKKEQP